MVNRFILQNTVSRWYTIEMNTKPIVHRKEIYWKFAKRIYYSLESSLDGVPPVSNSLLQIKIHSQPRHNIYIPFLCSVELGFFFFLATTHK